VTLSRSPARPSRHLVVLIAGVTVVPLLILVWLGWRLLEQDAALEHQQIQQRVERAADLIVTALRQKVSFIEQQLDAGGGPWSSGVLVADFDSDGVRVASGRVAYLPAGRRLPEAPTSLFIEGERLEFIARSPESAAKWFKPLTESANRAVAAGALVRLGRTLSKAGKSDEAAAAYQRLTSFDDVSIGGVPASLAGMYARGRVLQEQRREPELRKLGVSLRDDLLNGRWPVAPSVYRLYATDAVEWSGATAQPAESEIFAEALSTLWLRWKELPPALRPESARETVAAGKDTLTVLTRTVDGSSRVMMATAAAVESELISSVASFSRAHHVSVDLREAGTIDGNRVRRGSADSGLPWTLTVSTLQPPPEQSAFRFRRYSLIAGFALLLSMAALAGYSINRAVNTELTTARMQSEFVATVSHEFRTPLTTLRQFTDMLRDQPSLSPERRIVAYEAQSRATERLTRLVESMLDFGRMEAGARRYRFEARDCTSLVRRTVEEFSNAARSSGHTLAFAADGPAPIEGDEEALATAVRNLLDNAVKYSPQAKSVDVGVARRNGHVLISVRDHGIGIPGDEHDQIFTKFHRGEQARTRGIKGTGIGLATVHEIIKAHRGRVEVESAPGAGSTFTIVLPAQP
jgi:signal transduction histidine kinase